MEHMDQFYTAFQQISEEEWKVLKDSISNNSYVVLPVIYLRSRLIQKDGIYYIESAVATNTTMRSNS